MGNVDHLVKSWREGHASLTEVRSMSTELGRQGSESNVPVLIELLHHPDSIVRYNAAMSLAFKLAFRPAVRTLLAMLVEDEDEDCRHVAAGGAGFLLRNSKDKDAIAALGRAAIEDSDEDVRNAAYKALLCVNGISDEQYLQLLQDTHLLTNTEHVREIMSTAALNNSR